MVTFGRMLLVFLCSLAVAVCLHQTLTSVCFQACGFSCFFSLFFGRGVVSRSVAHMQHLAVLVPLLPLRFVSSLFLSLLFLISPLRCPPSQHALLQWCCCPSPRFLFTYLLCVSPRVRRFGQGPEDHFFPDISRGPCSVCPRNSCVHTTARFNSTGNARTPQRSRRIACHIY